MVDTIITAFISSFKMSLPFFCGEGGQSDQLMLVVGDVRVVEEGVRWHTLHTV